LHLARDATFQACAFRNRRSVRADAHDATESRCGSPCRAVGTSGGRATCQIDSRGAQHRPRAREASGRQKVSIPPPAGVRGAACPSRHGDDRGTRTSCPASAIFAIVQLPRVVRAIETASPYTARARDSCSATAKRRSASYRPSLAKACGGTMPRPLLIPRVVQNASPERQPREGELLNPLTAVHLERRAARNRLPFPASTVSMHDEKFNASW